MSLTGPHEDSNTNCVHVCVHFHLCSMPASHYVVTEQVQMNMKQIGRAFMVWSFVCVLVSESSCKSKVASFVLSSTNVKFLFTDTES